MESTLIALNDIEGVVGSFVVDVEGGVLARHMPAVVDDAALSGAARRVLTLRAALESRGDRCEHAVLRFGGYLLVVRAAHSATLCVLVTAGTNLRALHMGTVLTARKVASLAAHVPRQIASSRAHTGEAPAPRESGPAPRPAERNAPPTTRLFRGRRV